MMVVVQLVVKLILTLAVLTVNPTSVGGTVSSDATVCTGINGGTLTLAGYTGNIVRWESSTDNFATVITPIANTTTSQNYTNLIQTTQYRAVVQSGVCPSDNSTFATITVTANNTAGAPSTHRHFVSTQLLHQLSPIQQPEPLVLVLQQDYRQA